MSPLIGFVSETATQVAVRISVDVNLAVVELGEIAGFNATSSNNVNNELFFQVIREPPAFACRSCLACSGFFFCFREI